MKRLFILLALLTVSLNTLAQRYLINTATPVSSYMYKAYGKSGGMDLAGGLDWGGERIQHWQFTGSLQTGICRFQSRERIQYDEIRSGTFLRP